MSKFLDDLRTNADAIRTEWAKVWHDLDLGPISQEQALHTLDVLWRRSHLDILENIPDYAKQFPTQQRTVNRLENVPFLWWVDHATAGVTGWGTLKWFSSQPHQHHKKFLHKSEAEAYAVRRKGKVLAADDQQQYVVTWTGLAGASTHFVIFTDGTPFYLVPIKDGCWGEPKRNGDGIHVEMVNALVVNYKDNQWCYWAGPLPESILAYQKPVSLDRSFRGATHMLPYMREQIIANIKLKRVIIAATGNRMGRDRMSQHTDWQVRKYDMGPLWPFQACNKASFETYPASEYSFLQDYATATAPISTKPLNAVDTVFQIEEDLDGDTTIDSVKEVQQALVKLYGTHILPKGGVDGVMGDETTEAVRIFQSDWNRNYPKDRITIDGVAGIKTCGRLEEAITIGLPHKTTL